MNLQIREALPSDRLAIFDVVIAAFGNVEGQEITALMADLMEDPSALPRLSLVATLNESIVGHILFTQARIEPARSIVSSAILAPLSVHPDYQNQGIGGKLIAGGLKHLQVAGVAMVFVLGHPGYYPKHGFSAAGKLGFDAPYPIAPENSDAWMVRELQPGIIGHIRGKVVCAEALNKPKYWRE